MNELGINATSPVDLLAKAKEIVCRHKELQAKASKLQIQVANLEQEQNNLILQRQQEIAEKYLGQEAAAELSPSAAQEFILREISSTLAHRKKLHSQVSRLEGELMNLEKTNEERKQAQSLYARQQQTAAKVSRKSREYRTRSQDWPDVPDIAKIEEQNPEILAQKILETGRKIEASKMSGSSKTCPPPVNGIKPNSQRGLVRNNMPAPLPHPKKARTSTAYVTQKAQEPPKIANFEDRLKSIITSVLNEDHQNRTKSQSAQVYSPPANHYQPNVPHQYGYGGAYPPKVEEKARYKYARTETVVRPPEDLRQYAQQEGLAGGLVECYREPPEPQVPRQLTVEQPDYTQVSPVKLALRRHLSQEKIVAQHYGYNHQDGIVGTRTIGDLVSGEIERTLEISNQSIINAAVDMSDIQGTATLTSRSVVNTTVPPRPERVNVKAPEIPAKESEPVRQVYSPISRPSSAEGLEGLAYMHPHIKVPGHGMGNFVAPQAVSPRQPQYSPRSAVMYNFVPEGLAASLAQHIKEEVDSNYDRRGYMVPAMPSYPEQAIKMENMHSDCQYKRESPIIHGPVRKILKRCGFSNDPSNETHSNTSTPLGDIQDPPKPRRTHEDGKLSYSTDSRHGFTAFSFLFLPY